MLGDQRPSIHPSLIVFGGGRSVGRREAVNGAEPLGEPTDGRRQPFVSSDGVGPLGVTAVRRDHLGAQDRRRGRIDRGSHVGVPIGLVEAATGAVARLEPVSEDRVDRGVVRIGDRIEQRMSRRRRPERRGEPQVVVVVDELVAEEHHLPLQQRRADLGDVPLRQRLRQIHAVDLGSRPARLRSDVECLPCLCLCRRHAWVLSVVRC